MNFARLMLQTVAGVLLLSAAYIAVTSKTRDAAQAVIVMGLVWAAWDVQRGLRK